MSPVEGLLFLFAGIVVFVGGILLMVARERRRGRPRQTVAHFQSSRSAMRKIFSAQVARRDAARARARAAHPAQRRKRSSRQHRRSA